MWGFLDCCFTECIEELGNLIEAYGISVCQPSASVAVKNIAGQIGDRDNGVRNAALNAAVQAYMDVGSENQFYKLTGNVSSVEDWCQRVSFGKLFLVESCFGRPMRVLIDLLLYNYAALRDVYLLMNITCYEV